MSVCRETNPLTLPPCRICTGIASGIHYGVNTCEACKAFFRRALMEKDKYQCSKNNNCEIVDRKRGNCSWCRFQKCLKTGMSRNAVRHGRYTVAIRTKTILEVKRLEGKQAVLSSDAEKSSSDSSSYSESSPSTMSPPDFLNSPIMQLDPDIPVIDAVSPDSAVFTDDDDLKAELASYTEKILKGEASLEAYLSNQPYMDELEIQKLIYTLVQSQEAIYPNMKKYFDKSYTDKMSREFYENAKLKEEIFNTKSVISTEEFKNFYMATGIDVDGRLKLLQEACEHMQRGIIKYITFARSIPGFSTICQEDKLNLIKAARFEYWMLGHYLHYNPELDVNVGYEIKQTKTDSIKMWGSEEAWNTVNAFSKSLLDLNLSFEEIALLRGIVILFTDRCQLKEPEKVESLQLELIKCLKYLIKHVHPNEEKRFYRYFDRLIEIRKLTELNKKQNTMLEKFQMSIIKNYPLMYECISEDITNVNQ